jgi:glycosyltransferase involved in cell wall biosynthesis
MSDSARSSRTVHVVLPNDIDDPTSPSGGNVYDRRMCRGLADVGWSVREHAIAGAWPRPGPAERDNLDRRLAALPDGALVVLDGLVASAVPDVLGPQGKRLRLVILMHMPLGGESRTARHRESRALAASVAVITTSEWCRGRLHDLYDLPAGRVHVAVPGVDPAPVVTGSAGGTELLCVGAVTPHKGQDVLVAALSTIRDRPWRCVFVGPLNRSPGFVRRLRRQVRAGGLADRVDFVGPCTGRELEARYAAADLLVLASLGETYGMVVTEALARGVPVLGTAVKGLPEALGRAPDGELPGMLVPGNDPTALAGALERWLGDSELRDRLRRAARGRRVTLTGWSTTAERIATALSGLEVNVGASR